MWSSSEVTWGGEPTARRASRIEVARLPHSPQPTDPYEARADIGRRLAPLWAQPRLQTCLGNLLFGAGQLESYLPTETILYTALLAPAQAKKKKPTERDFQNQDCAWAKTTEGVHLEGTFRTATWGGRGTESLVGPVKVASETL